MEHNVRVVELDVLHVPMERLVPNAFKHLGILPQMERALDFARVIHNIGM